MLRVMESNHSLAHWREVLGGPAKGQHIAQTYQDERFLIEAVGVFAGAGLNNGDGILLAATKPHLRAFTEQVTSMGFDVDAAKRQGQWRELASDEVLVKVMEAGRPNPEVFKQLASKAIRETRGPNGNPRLRIFGELVNILWMTGNLPGAMAIEALWDELGKTYPFTLFCGYRMDNFGKAASSGPFQSVCQSHSHLIPAEDYDRLDGAVNRGSEEVLGKSLASTVRDLATASSTLSASMPTAQKTLIWLRENMPATAEKVSSRTREYYHKPS